MKIPASFKVSNITYYVKLTKNIEIDKFAEDIFTREQLSYKKIKGNGIIFGLCDPGAQTIWLATENQSGDPISEERIEATFYHELAHALVGETANMDANADEVFIEALGKNIFAFVSTISDEEADYEEDEKEVEEVEEEPKKTTKKKSNGKN